MINGLAITLAAVDPVAHVTDKQLIGWYISNVTIMLILSAVVTALIVIPAAKRIAPRTGDRSVEDLRAQGLLANLVETVCVYLREEVFRPMFHEETDKYIHILWTFFWFILIANLLGLIPFIDLTMLIAHYAGAEEFHGVGGTATQSIWVTGALAFLAFLLINGVPLWKDPIGYFKHLTGGVPFSWPMLPVIAIMVVVEIISTFVKPFALAVRLFANMTGGHIMLAVLFSFVPMLIQGLGGVGYPTAVLPLLGSIGLSLLEVLVAVIQAFIFTFLTGLFLAQLVVHDHEEEAEHHQPEDYEEKPGLEVGPVA